MGIKRKREEMESEIIFMQKFDNKEYKKCKIMYCEKVAFKNGLCENDYIFDCKNKKDDCCICRENNGAWIKLNCGHVLHKECNFYNGSKEGCPLCSKKIEYKKCIYNYDFIHD